MSGLNPVQTKSGTIKDLTLTDKGSPVVWGIYLRHHYKSDKTLIIGDCNIHLNKTCNLLRRGFPAVNITVGFCKCKTAMCTWHDMTIIYNLIQKRFDAV